ncbi:MAG: carbohydrate kinase family protein, partial [Ignavibacteriaceae bacterium]
VYLNITDDNERGECYTLINQKLSVEQINDFKIFNGILINMITGYDITNDQLRKIRSGFDGPIFFDVHTLARGFDEKGARNFRTIPGFEKWAENIDILQVNEIEFSSLFNCESKKEIIGKLFKCGVKILLVTKGELGARAYYKKDNEIISTFVSSLKTETKNRVGCGDVFGTVFFYNYIKDLDITKALKLANIAGGCTASYEKIENFERLKVDVYERLG